MDWFSKWFNFNTESAYGLVHTLLKLVNPVYAASTGAVNLLKEAASKWYATYLELEKIPNKDLSRELYKEKIDLINRGQSIIDKIKMMGLGADTLQGQLGALPVIAIGVILTAASLMLYWTYDFIKFKDKLAEYRAARLSGASIKDATSVVDALNTGGLFSGVNKLVQYGIVAGGLFTMYKIAQTQRWIK